MRNRTPFLIITIIVLLLVLLGGTVGAMALTHSGFMANGYNQRMMGNQQGYPTMMGSQPGSSGMMGSNQSTPTQQGTPVTGVTKINMHNSAYQPANIQVRVGTTVTWTNQDEVPHTVTFRNDMPGNSMMGSSMMTHGQSFSYTFRMPGTYHYYCTVHPSMVATVTVVS
jgi:amicyanin